jgi:hypothetical protein
MRHEKVAASGRLDMADIAAVWPASAQIAPVPIPDVGPGSWEDPVLRTPVAGDGHAGVRRLVIAAFVALLAAFAASVVTGIL